MERKWDEDGERHEAVTVVEPVVNGDSLTQLMPETCLLCQRRAKMEIVRGGTLPDYCCNGGSWGWCFVSRIAWARVD
jgi:hypothetical protein